MLYKISVLILLFLILAVHEDSYQQEINRGVYESGRSDDLHVLQPSDR